MPDKKLHHLMPHQILSEKQFPPFQSVLRLAGIFDADTAKESQNKDSAIWSYKPST